MKDFEYSYICSQGSQWYILNQEKRAIWTPTNFYVTQLMNYENILFINLEKDISKTVLRQLSELSFVFILR